MVYELRRPRFPRNWANISRTLCTLQSCSIALKYLHFHSQNPENNYKRHHISPTLTLIRWVRRYNYWSNSEKSFNLLFWCSLSSLAKLTPFSTARWPIWTKTSFYQTVEEDFFRLHSNEAKRTQRQTLNGRQCVVVAKSVVFGTPKKYEIEQINIYFSPFLLIPFLHILWRQFSTCRHMLM